MSRGAVLSDAPGPAGLNLMAAMDPRDVGRNTFSDSVVRALLYSHGLVLEDPLVMAAELHVGSKPELRSLSRRFLEAATVSLGEIDTLIDAGIVETFFVSSRQRQLGSSLETAMVEGLRSGSHLSEDDVWDAFEAGYVEGLSEPLRELWRLIRGGNRNPPIELISEALTESDVEVVRTFVDVVAEIKPAAVVDNTVAIVASAVDDMQRLGARHDILCASELFARLLFLGTEDPVAELRVSQLARTAVPGIERLSLADVVSIRQTSDAFDTWRSHLSLGLERAHRLRDDLGPEVDVPAAVAEHLALAKEQLFAEVQRSKATSQAGLVAFAAGTLGGVVSGAAGGVAGGLLGAIGGLTAAAGQRAAEHFTRGPAAVRRHYVVFERSRKP